MAAKKVIQGNPLSFRPSSGIFLKEISKILAKRSSLELLVLLLMNIYFIFGIRDMLRNCFKTKEQEIVIVPCHSEGVSSMECSVCSRDSSLRFAPLWMTNRGVSGCQSVGVPSMECSANSRDSSLRFASLRFALNDKRGLSVCHSAGVPST